jgi:hypothetical protein
MDVQVVDTLAAILAVINDNSVAGCIKSFLLGDLGYGDHQVADHSSVGVVSLTELGEALSILWDHQKVSLRNWCDVSESKANVILVDDVGWDFF